MSEHEDNETPRGVTPVERQVIQDVISAQVEARRQEQLDHEHLERRRARDERAQRRRSDDITQAKTRKAAKLKGANEANVRVRANVAAAAKSLSAALRDATVSRLPRHSDEGRRQQRTIRAIEAAMASLRGAGAGEFDETNFEIDLDLDVG